MFKTGFLVIQRDCHNHCVFCSASRLADGNVLTTACALRLVDRFIESGINQLIVSGGEPLHHPGLLEVISYARTRGINWVSLFTTACFDLTGFTPAQLDKAGLTSMMISVFGHSARIHDSVARRKGSFDETVAGIKSLGSAKFKRIVNTPIMRANYKNLNGIMDILVENEIGSWMLSDIHPTTAVIENVNVHVSYNKLRNVIQEAVPLAQSRGIRVSLQEYPLCILDDKIELSQELNLGWYTTYISEYPFNSGNVVDYAPISTPSRVYAEHCRNCEARYYCRGVPTSYLNRYGADFESRPLEDKGLHSRARDVARRYLRRTKGIS